MSYDFKLAPDSNHRIFEEEHIFEDNRETIVLDFPIVNANVKVRINDFERKKDFKTEIIEREIVTNFRGSGNIFYTEFNPLFNGLKIGTFASSASDFIVKIKRINENVSSQFLLEPKSFLLTEKTPILKSNRYDFNLFVEPNDINFRILNSSGKNITSQYSIIDIDARNGRVTFNKLIPLKATVYVTYYYKAQISSFDFSSGKIVLSTNPDIYSITNESLTISNNSVILKNYPIINGTYTIYKDGTPLIEKTDYVINLENGKIDLLFNLGTSTLTADYNYGFIAIKYFRQVENGWYLNPSSKSLNENARDVVFDRKGKTNREHVVYENVSQQFSKNVPEELSFTSTIGGEKNIRLKHKNIVSGSYDVYVNNVELIENVDYTLNILTGLLILTSGLNIGDILTTSYKYRTINKNYFFTQFVPLLPLYQDFYSLPNDTLNNAVVVLKVIDITNEKVSRIDDYYSLRFNDILLNSYSIYKNGILLVEGRDYNLDRTTGKIDFLINIRSFDIVLANYSYGDRLPVSSVNPQTGKVVLYDYPEINDIIYVSYFYQNSIIPDRLSIDYSVSEDYCPKCSLRTDLVDYKKDGLGNYIRVYRENKLAQDLRKIIETDRGSDPVALWYGTTFNLLIGMKIFPEYVQTKISSEILEALTRLKNAQIQQEDYQFVDPREFLDFIKELTVEQDTVDTTFWSAFVDVVTQAGNSFVLEEPVQLSDSTVTDEITNS